MFRSMPRIVLPPMVVVPRCAGETVVVVKDRLMDLPVNPNFTQFRSREPADSRVEKFVKAYTKANCEVRVNMVLEEAITWPKMLVKAFEKMHQMRKVGFKRAASLKRQSKPRNPESLKVRDIVSFVDHVLPQRRSSSPPPPLPTSRTLEQDPYLRLDDDL